MPNIDTLARAFGSSLDLLAELRAPLLLAQGRRLLQIETVLPHGTLAVERAQWVENISGLGDAQEGIAPLQALAATVDCLSTSAYLELKTFIGERASLRVLQADGSYRTWHGHVVEAAQLGTDGGFAAYRLKLAGFTCFMNLRTDTRVFRKKRADEIIREVLSAYPQADFRFDLASDTLEATPVRGTTTQWQETDAAFVARLAAEEGWNWHFEHSDSGAAPGGAQAGSHCLVIGDALATRADLGSIRFGRPDMRGRLGGLAEDKVTAFGQVRAIQPNVVTHAAWDPTQLAGVSAQAVSARDNGALPPLEIYDGAGERLFSRHDTALDDDVPDSALAERRAGDKLARHELAMKTVHGESAVRTLAAGADFALADHFLYDPAGLSMDVRPDARFRVLQVIHEAANNLGTRAAQLFGSHDLEAGSYRNRFTAVPAAARVLPRSLSKPKAFAHTAVVVGPDGEEVSTDRDLRVRVQFPWQRGAASLAGGLDGPETPAGDATGHAPGDTGSSMPVRVAQPMAGANWGCVFTPRIGTEVLVEFMDGDIDRPVILGQLHNGADAMPWPGGVDSGANHPGAMSGWQSRELGGDGLNQWIIDDTTGQCRMRLASLGGDSPWSELSIGYIISQGARSTTRGRWLGSGFYAHTDGWASIRAEGLLVTTAVREGTYGSARGTQMDAEEAIAGLEAAQQLGQALGGAAAPQGAMALASHAAAPSQALQRLIDAADPRKDGHAQARVGGQPGLKAKDGSRALGDPVERFAAPVILMHTPSSLALTSPATLAGFSGRDTSVTTGRDWHVSARHTGSIVSGQATSLYNHEGDLKACAANGDLGLKAHTDALELLADQDVKILSTNDEIRITARHIEMIGGESKVTLDGSDIEFLTPGAFTVKGASHALGGGGGGASQELPALPDTRVKLFDEAFVVRNQRTHELLVRTKYRIRRADGSYEYGTTDDQGMTHLVRTMDAELLTIEVVEEA